MRRLAGSRVVWDVGCLAAFICLWLVALVLRYDALPLQPWDEGRNIVNAYGMASGQGWLVPLYEGAPDHWQEKPPVLTWSVAALLRLGLPDLLALRLPSFTAVLASILVMWAVCRFALRDRIAGLIAGLLLLSSTLFLGIHVGRTGDFDALLSLFALCSVITFWAAVAGDGPVRVRWFAACGAAVALAIMTKGVAGAFAPAGLALFAALTGRLRKLLGNTSVWLIALASIGVCLLYYFGRELVDPGYLRAVWWVELGGRFGVVNEGHAEPEGFYLAVLAWGYTAGVLLLPLLAVGVLSPDKTRRALAQACAVTALVVLGILTLSRTKIYWYAAPVIPLLTLATALGASELLARVSRRRTRWLGLPAAPAVAAGLAIVLLAGIAATIKKNQRDDIYVAYGTMNGQYWYGKLLDWVSHERPNRSVTVLDAGLRYQGGPEDFNPLLRYYADRAIDRGIAVEIVHRDALATADALTATCDPAFVPLLLKQAGFQSLYRDRWCVAGSRRLGSADRGQHALN